MQRSISRTRNPARDPQPAFGGERHDNEDGPEMIASVEDFQKFAKDNADNAQKVFGTLSKGLQTIAAEIGDYSKKSFEEGSAALEQLAGAKSLDKVVEIQSDYAKKSYEGFVAQSTKVGELYVDLAKEMAKPFEALVPKAK